MAAPRAQSALRSRRRRPHNGIIQLHKREVGMGTARVLAAAVAIAGKSNSAAVAASCGGSMNKGRIKPDKTR